MEKEEVKAFGFWIYLMTDLVIFAVLFASYIVLQNKNYGGPTSQELYRMSTALQETLILLTSSFTCALGMLSVHAKNKGWSTLWYIITFGLGIAFLTLEISEFFEFVNKGANWQRSAFLSSFFTLVGTHGFHVTIGLLWMAVELFRIWLRPFTESNISRVYRMALFWHFLDFIWIFIFTVVYGWGHLQ